MRYLDPLRRPAVRCVFLLLWLGGAAGAAERSPRVCVADLEAIVARLASDELAGRKTGTEGERLATAFLAAELGAAGLEPAGKDGSFLQEVPLVRRVVAAPARLQWWDETGAEHTAIEGRDFRVLGGDGSTERLDVVVWDGSGEPPADRAVLALDRGVARALSTSEVPPRLRLELGSRRPGREPDSPRVGRLSRRGEGDGGAPRLRLSGALREAAEAGHLAAVRLVQDVRLESVTAHNVVARLRGAGRAGREELAEQVVVLSAHLDHLGVREPRPDESDQADRIFNGADDDASGCAAVVEIAAALAAGPPPARTVVVLLATGEEMGLLGTEEYLEHPVEPLERTVLNLNFEMLGRPDELAGGPGRLWLTGHERTNLLEDFESAGLPIGPDPRPDQHFFERSDNIAFAMRGIVAQTLSSYGMHQDYHRPSDEVETLDLAHMEAATRSALAAVRRVTDGEFKPRWLPGGRPEPRRAR